MTIREIQRVLDARMLTDAPIEKEITGVYLGDIMSMTIARGFPGMAWITTQANMNALAVAHMKKAACLIFPESILPDENVVGRARKEAIALLVCGASCYEAAGRLYEASLRQTEHRRKEMG